MKAPVTDQRSDKLTYGENNTSNPLLSCLGRRGYIPGYDDLWKEVIRPPRDMYTVGELGPTEFMIDDKSCMRQDVLLTNAGGHTLACSHYLPRDLSRTPNEQTRRWPCVVFCHGNSSSRLEAKECVQVCLPRNISVFCFDFTGCGMSGGEYVTLGHVERQDLRCVLQYLRKSEMTASLALWGRSMGASTAIFCAAEDHDLAAVVLDSPFTRLRKVAVELGGEAIPRFMLNMGIDLLRDEVRARTGADLDGLAPIESAPKARCPAIFAASVEDDFIQPYHAKELQQAWGGASDLYYFNGAHNDERPEWFMKEAADWLVSHLYPGKVASR